MEIKLRNDGKKKAQSCEAEIELSSKNHAWRMYFWLIFKHYLNNKL